MSLATIVPILNGTNDDHRAASDGAGATIARATKARREKATLVIGRQLRHAEDKLDEAGIAMAELLMVSLQARRDAKISATFGHDLASAQIEALRTWSQSRSQTVDWHKKALRYAGVLGTRIVAEGDTDRPNDG